MKKIISIVFCAVLAFCMVSCAKDSDLLDDVQLTGKIMGVVRDATDGHLLSTVNVSLTPDNKSCVTDADGGFNFTALKTGSYTLMFKKTGYDDVAKTVSVKAGETIDASVTMRSKGAFAISTSSLDFGDLNANMAFTIVNNSDAQCSYEIKNVPDWASFSQTSGTVSAQGSSSISVMVDRDKVDYGQYTHNVVLSYRGKSEGSVTLTLSMEKVKLSAPEVTIAEQATEVTKNGFVIAGQLQATGGSIVTDYGHCWSLTPNPTIEDSRSSNGSTKECCEFTTTVSDLAVGTTYYVRAYAINAQGISYSQQVIVMTEEAQSNKWDGTKARAFAGGNGTFSNPYMIETGAQLVLMMDYNDKYFELASNIDLDNKNWKPMAFEGTLNGAGYTISNLYVDRTDDNQGLFSVLDGDAKISNLTIKGVKIEAVNYNNIGALCGEVQAGSFDNVNVIFTDNSIIKGNDYVGGLIGRTIGNNYGRALEYTNVTVTSTQTKDVIVGNSSVGGVCGYNSGNNKVTVNSVSASVSVKGNKYVGGIFGEYRNAKIEKCKFTGNVTGSDYVAGLVGCFRTGMSGPQIVSCKVNANIKASENAGGIYCFDSYGSYNPKVIACYTTGTISGSKTDGFGTNTSWQNVSIAAELSYTTMSCGFSNSSSIKDCATTSSVGGGSNVKTNCANIVTHLKESYSQYAEYWDFDRTWTWTGKVDGKEVNVSCPLLKWE